MADAPKKMTTAEILAKLRAETAGKTGAAPPADAPPTAESAPAEAPVAAAAPAETRKTTAEILAAARTQTTPAEAAPAAPKPAGGPKSTSDILAAARAEREKKAAAGGAAPSSTSDILARARAEKTAAAASATTEAPAAKPTAKPAAKTTATTAVVPDGLTVEQMLAAVRPGEVAVAKPKPVKAVVVAPPMPQRPMVAKKKTDESRRGFVAVTLGLLAAMFGSAFGLAWTLFAVWVGGATLLTARFMLPNVLTEPPRKFKIGPPTDYDLGTVATKWVAAYGVWIVHTDQYQGKNLIYALASVCTHLGCTPSWLEGEQKFKCPCHGSGFYITGVNFEGPAPRPLERVGIRLAEDGMLEVDKSLKFQEEMGQWNDPNSFLALV